MIFHADASAARHRAETERTGYVTFTVAGQWLGIEVVLVQEVLVQQSISQVPLAPREVSGFLNLRGQIVTAIDLRARLALAPRAEDDTFMNIVVRDGGELFSLLVDEVGDVVEVAGHQLEPTPATLDDHWKACCGGVIRLEQGLLAILEVDQLLQLTGVDAVR